MWRIAHRGASAYAPENTLLAFDMALKQGADGIECDVHLCKSGEPMVIHDHTLKRTTNGNGLVKKRTLAQLRKLDAGKGQCIPTLREAIEHINGRAVFFIEIKDKNAIAPTVKLITKFAKKSHIGYGRLPVLAFSLDWLQVVRKLDKGILLGIGSTRPISRNFALRAQEAGMWAVNPCIDTLAQSVVDDIHHRGMKIITWTANKPAQIAKAKKLGVDGIIGDYPDRL